MSVGVMRDRSETNPKTEGSTRLNDVKEQRKIENQGQNVTVELSLEL
jgi:hypothetical protein